MKRSLLLLFFFLAPIATHAAVLSVFPADPIQGDPLLISISGITSPVQSISFAGKTLGTFSRNGSVFSLYGIDLYKDPGTYQAIARFADGTIEKQDVTVSARKKIEAPLGIPEKLGGNTPQAASNLVSTLSKENASLLHLRTGSKAFWTKPFAYPVKDPVVTDSYGYQRQTGGYSIAHKGTDFRASSGTPVLAMNRGVVRLVQNGRNYGKTIVVDHGLGLQTLYLHLSKIYVNTGELVVPGQTIGLSGETGYAEKPHLHLSVRINDVSIDPEKFMTLFTR